LWFWGTELGWATVHGLLDSNGWEYRSCHIWNKGLAHVAGNTNTQTLRKLPVVTEVCVQYVREVRLPVEGKPTPKAWLRSEWGRTGLALYRTNEACNVRNAATRKYFTQCRLWYPPPADTFDVLVNYANRHGKKSGQPYFTLDGKRSLGGEEWISLWTRLRAKFHCELGVTNVWDEPAVRGEERLKNEGRSLHGNQKPVSLLKRIILASSDPGDAVWDPFAGLGSVGVASLRANRLYYGTEIRKDFYDAARKRLRREGA
jgi:site-specific DNA-methyltransferase (adenine-specific)